MCCCCILLVVALVVLRKKGGGSDSDDKDAHKEVSLASQEPDEDVPSDDADVVVYGNIGDIALSDDDDDEDGVVYADLNQFAEKDIDDDVWTSSEED